MSTLYTYFRSSASFRVRIVLRLKSIQPDEQQVIDLRAGEQSAESFLKVNQQGFIPAWVDDQGIFQQSLAIMEYLEERYPAPALMPTDWHGRARVRALSQLIACEIHPLNNLRVLQYLRKQLNQTEDAVNQWYRHWCHEGLSAVERQLTSDRATGLFMHGDQPTLADCCLVPQIFNAQRFSTDLTPFPKTMEIFHRCMAIPAFDLAQPAKQPEAERFKE